MNVPKRACWVRVLCLVPFLLVSLRLSAGPQWQQIPLQGQDAEYAGVRSFALAADGTPWAAFDKPHPSICYFDGHT
jgi:hypothetical protein